MNIDKNKQEYIFLVETLSNFFELSDDTKFAMFEKISQLDKSELNQLKKYIFEYMDTREKKVKNLLNKVKVRQVEIEELIDRENEKSNNLINVNNI